jgi:hypothetical protein
MNLVMAIEANRKKEFKLVQPVSEPSSTVMNLARHLGFAHLAHRIVAKELFPHILVHLILPSPFG